MLLEDSLYISYTLLKFLNHELSIQLLGLVIDITGAFYLSRAFIFKNSADIKSETYGNVNQKLLIFFGMSGNLFFSFYTQGIEARIGFFLLLFGFVLQGIGIIWPAILIPAYIILTTWLMVMLGCKFIHGHFTKFERVKNLHDRDEKQHDKRLQK